MNVLKATDTLGNVAFIKKRGDRVSCVLFNGIPTALSCAGFDYKREAEAEIRLSMCESTEDMLHVAEKYGSHRWTYEAFV